METKEIFISIGGTTNEQQEQQEQQEQFLRAVEERPRTEGLLRR